WRSTTSVDHAVDAGPSEALFGSVTPPLRGGHFPGRGEDIPGLRRPVVNRAALSPYAAAHLDRRRTSSRVEPFTPWREIMRMRTKAFVIAGLLVLWMAPSEAHAILIACRFFRP